MRVIVIASPFMALGGGGKRAFEVLSRYSEFGIETILYTPRSVLERLRFIKAKNEREFKELVINPLKRLERRGVLVPNVVYDVLESEELYVHVPQKKERAYKFHVDAISKLSQLLTNFRCGKMIELEVSHLSRYLKEVSSSIDIIYAHHEAFEVVYPAFQLSKKLKKPFAMLLQSAPFLPLSTKIRLAIKYPIPVRNRIVKFVGAILTTFMIENAVAQLYKKILKCGFLKAIVTVSGEPIVSSKLNRIANKYNVRIIRQFPACAVDKEIFKYRKTVRKRNIVVYFARLTPEKGVFEIPYIARELIPNTRLVVFGKFYDNSTKAIFDKICKKLGVEVELRGFVTGPSLWKAIAEAKVVIYPSHRDANPLAVLESLALGTHVVAYDILALREIYSRLKPVRRVPEWNLRAMVSETLKVLNMEEESYAAEHCSMEVQKFLKEHSSWDNVARKEAFILKNLLQK